MKKVILFIVPFCVIICVNARPRYHHYHSSHSSRSYKSKSSHSSRARSYNEIAWPPDYRTEEDKRQQKKNIMYFDKSVPKELATEETLSYFLDLDKDNDLISEGNILKKVISEKRETGYAKRLMFYKKNTIDYLAIERKDNQIIISYITDKIAYYEKFFPWWFVSILIGFLAMIGSIRVWSLRLLSMWLQSFNIINILILQSFETLDMLQTSSTILLTMVFLLATIYNEASGMMSKPNKRYFIIYSIITIAIIGIRLYLELNSPV